jgi:hypothetical protein
MSNYTEFYTSSDVSVFLENPHGGSPVQLDTLMTVGWQERLSSGAIFGLGEQRFGFVNAGNVHINGVLELNFTHHNYLKHVLKSLFDGTAKSVEQMLADFTAADLSTASNAAMELSRLGDSAPSKGSGIQALPEGFDIRVVFNNGSLYHMDNDKQFLIKGCKIDSAQVNVSTSISGHVSHSYTFIGREVI